MRAMTKVAVGGVGGLVAVGYWAWGLLGEIEMLRHEKGELLARCRALEEGLRRMQSERDTARAENACLQEQLQALRSSSSRA